VPTPRDSNPIVEQIADRDNPAVEGLSRPSLSLDAPVIAPLFANSIGSAVMAISCLEQNKSGKSGNLSRLEMFSARQSIDAVAVELIDIHDKKSILIINIGADKPMKNRSKNQHTLRTGCAK